MTSRTMLAAAVAVGTLALGAAPAAAITRGPRAGARPQLDVRAGERATVPAGVRAARHALAERLGIEAHVATDPVGGGLRVLDRTNGFLSGPRAGDAADVALAYVRAHAGVFGVDAQSLASLELMRRTTSGDGVTHLTWVPVQDGVPAYDSALRVHVTRDGRVLAAAGPPLGGLALPTTTPRLTASQALAVARNDVGAKAALPRAHTSAGPQRLTTFSDGDRASLVAFESPSGDRLAWRVIAAGTDPYVFEVVVDAASGEILARHSLTDFASTADVLAYHPGAAAGGTQFPVDITRWLNASATTLTGPYAHAYADPDNDDDFADAGEEINPNVASDWLYTPTPVVAASGQFCSSYSGVCTWDGANFSTETRNRAQATTQVFYFVSNFHDWLAQAPIGFDDASGNFELNGTNGSDPVLAEADDGGGVDNANMSTLPDGQSPRMQMYLFKNVAGAPWPAVNGADDASVVYHEYTHGLSNRLVDPLNADGLNANQSGAMGEGWSDWYAMDYLVAHGLVSDTGADGEVRVGEYVTDNRTRGIRTQPLDCSVGSAAPACGGSAVARHGGGYTYADLGRVGGYDASTPSFEVHDDGEIWSETLWDLRKTLGATTARGLITDAMRLSPLDPSFLDERDAILLADQIDNRGVNHDAIWQVFATRGMGYGARTTSPNATRAQASFATPHLVENGGSGYDDSGAFGDGDGVAEPGEILRFAVLLQNPGLVGLTHVHGSLHAVTPGVSVVVPDADFGAIAAGDSAVDASDYVLTLGSGLACGSQVQLTLHVTSDQGSFDVPLLISLGAGDAVFSSGDSFPKSIPDNSPRSGAVSTLSVPSGGRIDTLRATVNISHTAVGDLHAWLTSPAGTKVDLVETPFSGLDWSGPVTFDDGASQAIQDVPDGAGSLGTAYVPDEPLATFAGENRAGPWTLRVTDNYALDSGTLNGWSIDTDQPSCSTTTTLPLATTGAAGAVSTGGATLAGSVTPGGAATTYAFQYGATSAYGQTTATGSAGSGGVAVAESAAVSGLAAATTYHFRIVAFRDGVRVAAGADQTFTTSAGTSNVTPPPPTRPTPHVGFRTHRATVSARGTFVFAFGATGGRSGRIRFTIPKHGRTKAIAFGSRSFAVPASGRVRVTIKLSRRALAQLRRRHRLLVRVTVTFAGITFGEPLKLSAPAHRRRR
ncbi:MAG: M36 family metallopeptidase [Actinobacteria bacterium]|nr:M36 family metallopeptidase [Actinomycetota bacterium]